MNSIVIIYLLVLSLEDIWKKELPLWQIFLGTLGAVIVAIMQWNGGMKAVGEFVLSLIPAAVLLGAAWVSEEQIGYGDGLLMFPLGILLGVQKALCVLLWALLLAAVYALFLVAVYSRRKHMSVPFVPFLLAGYLLTGGVI